MNASSARVLLVALAMLGWSPVAISQDLVVDRYGGAWAAETRFELTGPAGRPYLLLFDFEETRIDLGGGMILEVGPRYASLAGMLPGFAGYTDASGKAEARIVLPRDPALDGRVLSLQALLISPLDAVSNLVRVTPAESGTFQSSLETPPVTLPSGLAPIAAQPSGRGVHVVSGLSVVALDYDADRESVDARPNLCVTGPFSSATPLADGRVLLAGGLGLDGQPTDRAVLHDPATGLCTEVQMTRARAGHAAARLASGEILISGGFEQFDLTDILAMLRGITNSTELFDPATNSFSAGPDLLEPKVFHAATPTADGGVLVSGGLTLIPILEIPYISNTAYKFDPGSKRFGFPVLFATGRMLHGATLLDNDRILLAGGLTIDFSEFLNSGNLADLAVVALDDGAVWKDGFLDGSFKTIPGLSRGRALPAVEALEDGRALVCGGFDLQLSGDISQWVFEALASADLYGENAFAETGAMNSARIAPLAYRLADGTVLVLGGAAGAEIYQP